MGQHEGQIAVPAGQGHFVGRMGRSMAGNEPYVIFQAQRWAPGCEGAEAELIGGAADDEARMLDHWLDPLRLASAQWPEQLPLDAPARPDTA